MAATQDTLIGRTIGKFRIDAKLGEGGMGAVYKAVDTSLDRTVALKVIKPELGETQDFLLRFRREAKAAARFRHPNAIEIYEYSDGKTSDGLLFMAFEFIKGQELHDMMRARGALTPAQTVHILAQVLSALEVAHQAGIVHRDLKPQNVMIEEGQDMRAKILDFGIAKMRDGSSEGQAITLAGQVMGTAYYMAPEQAMGKRVDGRTDLYSVGVILYQMLTGKLPFVAKQFMHVLEMHCNAEIPTLGAPQLAAFEPVIQKALAKKPDDRYQSAGEFRTHLTAALRAPGTSTPPARPSDRYAAPPLPTDAAQSGPYTPAPGEAYAQTSPMPEYHSGGTERFFASLKGRTIGKYVIEEELGEGGMGAVFRARDKLLGRPVALKVVHPSLSHRHDVRQRFLREARAALEFSHPNAIATRACDETPDGLLYMTQDYSKGQTLRKVLQEEKRLGLERALGVVRQVLLALAEAHSRKIVHRDLKPENMLVEPTDQGEDWVRVCDFGLAKLLDVSLEEDSGTSITQAGQSLGTPHYMAPEQADASPIDGRADLYSLGCMLYELLTGTKPFTADSIRTIVLMHMSSPPQSPSQRAPQANIPPAVEAIVLKAMEKEPSQRFQSAEEFLAAIDELGLVLPGYRISTSSHTRRATGRVGTDRLARASDLDTVTVPPTRPGGPPMFLLVFGGALAALLVVGGLVGGGWFLVKDRLQKKSEDPQVATRYSATDDPLDAKTGGKTAENPLAKTEDRKTLAAKTEAGKPGKTIVTKTDPGPKTPHDPDREALLEAQRAEKERIRKQAQEAEKERLRKLAADAEKERLRKLAADKGEKERQARLEKLREQAKQEEARLAKIREEARLEKERIARLKAKQERERLEAEKRKRDKQREQERQKKLEEARQARKKAAERRQWKGVLQADGRLKVTRRGIALYLTQLDARTVTMGRHRITIKDRWLSTPITVGQFARFVMSLEIDDPQRTRAEAYLRKRRYAGRDDGRSLIERIPARIEKLPAAGVPLRLARDLAKWLRLRVPTDGEGKAAAQQWDGLKAFWTYQGNAVASRNGNVIFVTQSVTGLRPRLRLVFKKR